MADERAERNIAYVRELFLPHDEVLEAALRRASEAGLRSIQVPPEGGRLLGILARTVGARRILEIGTLGGYSAIHLARALPEDGRLITLELDPHHAEVARENLHAAGLADRVEVRLGPALDTLPDLAAEAPFDLAFIDADKESYPAYLDWCLRLVRPGGLIVADNALDLNAGQIDVMNRAAAGNPRLDALILPVRYGSGGMLVAVVRE
jgi:predicted O-methyltransferase YrrM